MDTGFIIIALFSNLHQQNTSINIGCMMYIPKEYFRPVLAKELNILPLCNSLNIINKTKLNGIVE